MPISNVLLSNTFNEFRITTNSVITEVNKLSDGSGTLTIDTINLNQITSPSGLSIEGDLTVHGTTTTVSARNLEITDNMLYLNSPSEYSIDLVTDAAGQITYTTSTDHNYQAGMIVTVTGVNPSAYDITDVEIDSVTSNTFTVTNAGTGTYITGGTSAARVALNPDLGWSAGYDDGTYAHAGMFRDATDGVFKIYDSYTPEPDAALTIDTGHVSFALASLLVNGLQASSLTSSTLTLSGLLNQAAEATAVVIDGSNVVGTRELGTLAFDSSTYDNYSSFTVLENAAGTSSTVESGESLNFINGTLTTVAIVDQANPTVQISHNSVTRTDTTSSATLSHGGTFDIVSSVSSSAEGHITAIDVKTLTMPSDTDTTYSISAGDDGTSTTSYTLVLTDSGAVDDTVVLAVGQVDTTDGLTISRATDTITFSHANTSSQADVTNTGGNFVQSLTFDTYGHVTGVTSGAYTPDFNVAANYAYKTFSIDNTDTEYTWTTTDATTSDADSNTDTAVFVGGSGIQVAIDDANNAIRIAHSNTGVDGQDLAVNNSGNTFLQDLSITVDDNGHATAISSGSASVNFNVSDNYSFKTVALLNDAGGSISDAIATSNTDTLTIQSAQLDSTAGIVLAEPSANTITIAHANTSSQASVDNSNGNIIQDVTLDTYGHITGLASIDGDGRWAQLTANQTLSGDIIFSGTNTYSGSSSITGGATFNNASGLSAIFTNSAEIVTTNGTPTTAYAFDVITQAVYYVTANATGNWTINFRGDGSTTLDSIMSTGQSITSAFLATQGATPYYLTAVQVDGASQTVKWQGAAVPTAGNASGIDAYVITIIKTGVATFTVMGSQTQFA